MKTVDKNLAGTIKRYVKAAIEGKAITGMSEGTAADGGNLVERQITDAILDAMDNGGMGFYNKARKFKVNDGEGDGKLVPIGLNVAWNKTGTNDIKGIRALFVDEGAGATATKGALDQFNAKLGKLVVYVPVTEELMEDSVQLANWIISNAADALVRKVEYGMVNGLEAETVKGVLQVSGNNVAEFANTNSLAWYKTARKSLHPTVRDANWLIKNNDFSGIVSESTGYTFTNPTFLEWNEYDEAGEPLSLCMMGIKGTASPFIINGSLLADWSKYALVLKDPKILVINQGPRSEYGETVVRIILRVAGRPVAPSLLDGDINATGSWFIRSYQNKYTVTGTATMSGDYTYNTPGVWLDETDTKIVNNGTNWIIQDQATSTTQYINTATNVPNGTYIPAYIVNYNSTGTGAASALNGTFTYNSANHWYKSTSYDLTYSGSTWKLATLPLSSTTIQYYNSASNATNAAGTFSPYSSSYTGTVTISAVWSGTVTVSATF